LIASDALTSGRPATDESGAGENTRGRFHHSRICGLSAIAAWSSRMNGPDRLFEYARMHAMATTPAYHHGSGAEFDDAHRVPAVSATAGAGRLPADRLEGVTRDVRKTGTNTNAS
jgi:hypothetical protein